MQGPPDSKAHVLPDALNEDGVELVTMLADPGKEAWRISITAVARTESVHLQSGVFQPGIVGTIHAHDLDFVAETVEHSGRTPDRFNRPAGPRIKRVNRPKYPHPKATSGEDSR